MDSNVLIVGGTSGLGLELARIYSPKVSVSVAGRHDPHIDKVRYIPFAITHDRDATIHQIDDMLSHINTVDILIYTAGYYQEGRIDTLSDAHISDMIHVGLFAPALLVQRLKKRHEKNLDLILITSSSQYTPRELEPLYTATKAGLGMLGASLSFDDQVGKVLVVAPSGMKTPFWKGQKDISTYLDPTWVAHRVVELSDGEFKYRFAKIIRDPPRVEIVETRAH